MRRGALVSLTAAALIFSLPVATADAQHGQAATHPAPPPHAAAPPQSHGGSSHATTTHGGGGSHASSTHGGSTHAGSHSSSAHSSTAHGSHTTTTSTTTTGAKKTTSTRTATTSTSTLTPVQQKLAKNANLASKLQSRLPAGANLQTAAAGFRNLGQFVAAVNVSHNLGIPFVDLKRDMVTRGMSLGQSIQDLRPSTNATVEAEGAEHDADTLIAQTQTTMTTSTATTSKAKHKPGTHRD